MEHTLNTSILRQTGRQSSDSCRPSWSADFMDGQIYTETLRQNPKQSNHCNNKRKIYIMVNIVTWFALDPSRKHTWQSCVKSHWTDAILGIMRWSSIEWDHHPICWGNKRIRKRVQTDYDPCLLLLPAYEHMLTSCLILLLCYPYSDEQYSLEMWVKENLLHVNWFFKYISSQQVLLPILGMRQIN